MQGNITLPDGVGPHGANFTPTGLLNFLARRNKLQDWQKGNGWEGVFFEGRKLSEIREEGGRPLHDCYMTVTWLLQLHHYHMAVTRLLPGGS